MVLLLVLAGSLLGVVVMVSEKRAAYTDYLERKAFGEGAYEEQLIVHTGEEKQEIELLVEEQSYTEEDAQKQLKAAKEMLDTWMEEQKNSSGEITHDLELPDTMEESQVLFSWSTDRPEIMGWDGTLREALQKEKEKINLMCALSLGEVEAVWSKEVTVQRLDTKENRKLEREVQKEAERINEQGSKRMYLPKTIDGKTVTYEKQQENAGVLICFCSIFLGIGYVPLKKEREKKKTEKRQKEMQRDYPDIVEKMVLFLRAGFSIRKALEKMAYGYLRNREKYHTKARPAYEELVKTCRELDGGVYEAEAYERMGKRCGISEYKILSVILVQNLKKGNQSVLELLEREAASAAEERKRTAKVRGEEASVKLILPMIMQLIVVMIILMVPAFLSFYNR